MGGWWRWALVSPDGEAPSRMLGVSASVNLPLHDEVDKFFSGTGSPGWCRKKDRNTVVVVYLPTLFSLLLSFCSKWRVSMHYYLNMWLGRQNVDNCFRNVVSVQNLLVKNHTTPVKTFLTFTLAQKPKMCALYISKTASCRSVCRRTGQPRCNAGRRLEATAVSLI